MKTWRLALVASVLAFGLAGCAPFHNIPPMPAGLATAPVSAQDKADASNRALWGAYVDLVGTSRFSSRNGGTRIDWRWLRPGWVMEETWYIKGTDGPMNTYTLWRAEHTGMLYSQSPGLMGMAWQGAVQKDGSVLFVGAGPMSLSHQVKLTKDGVLEVRGAEIVDGVLVSLRDIMPTDRYEKTAALAARATAGKPTGGTDSSVATGATLAASGGAAGKSAPEAAEQAKRQQADEALRKADEALSQAEARVRQAQETLAAAQTEAQKTESAVKAMSAMRAGAKAAPKADVLGDFWSFCWYSTLQPDGKTGSTFVTELINERIWTEPWPFLSASARAEFDAYDGPNMPYNVEKRFVQAMRTSGLLPAHDGYASRCQTHVSLKFARDAYNEWRHKDPKPTYIVWKTLGDKHIQGSMKLPTAEEAAQLKQQAQEAQRKLKQAQAAAQQEARVAALRKEDAQRARDCAAGQLRACPRGTKN